MVSVTGIVVDEYCRPNWINYLCTAENFCLFFLSSYFCVPFEAAPCQKFSFHNYSPLRFLFEFTTEIPAKTANQKRKYFVSPKPQIYLVTV